MGLWVARLDVNGSRVVRVRTDNGERVDDRIGLSGAGVRDARELAGVGGLDVGDGEHARRRVRDASVDDLREAARGARGARRPPVPVVYQLARLGVGVDEALEAYRVADAHDYCVRGGQQRSRSACVNVMPERERLNVQVRRERVEAKRGEER